MHQFNLYVADILKDLRDRIQAAVGDVPVFVANRPVAGKKQRNEMVVVSIPYSVNDRGGIQSSYYRIEIIVKNGTEGLPNITKIEAISKDVASIFPLEGLDGRYQCKNPKLVIQGNDNLGFYVWNLQAGLLVNTLDSYNN